MHTADRARPVLTPLAKRMHPLDDPTRLAALQATGLLDSLPEESFDRITRLAAEFLDMPLSLVNLLDDHRQFSKSCFAPTTWPDDREASLDDSFCKWAVISREPVAIADARVDGRVAASAMVSDLGVVSYMGVPLITPDELALGTLCVAGFEPHRWTERDARVLRDLGACVVSEIELRRDILRRDQVERIKDELVSVVSHELRTPLTSIRASLGLLASGRLGELSSQGGRMVEIATQNTDRLVRLIADMLDLERLESGTLELERQWTGARDLLATAVDSGRQLARERGVDLEIDVEPDFQMNVDPDRMVQVVVNLVTNAVKFSPPGSVVRITGERRGPEALFAVRDRGRGIPAEQLERVFERFRQVDSSDAREKGGTGLGLPICRSIVQQHGGRIWVASEFGAGSTFFFSVPIAGNA